MKLTEFPFPYSNINHNFLAHHLPRSQENISNYPHLQIPRHKDHIVIPLQIRIINHISFIFLQNIVRIKTCVTMRHCRTSIASILKRANARFKLLVKIALFFAVFFFKICNLKYSFTVLVIDYTRSVTVLKKTA